jgi:hypothetical protein
VLITEKCRNCNKLNNCKKCGNCKKCRKCKNAMLSDSSIPYSPKKEREKKCEERRDIDEKEKTIV